ncbi:MAG: cytochrome bc complex cytochrome b subunit [Chloroflexota bacterium]|nr:cytochrome bc complex cytochrome b subunit [Chloroflexota bacterium]
MTTRETGRDLEPRSDGDHGRDRIYYTDLPVERRAAPARRRPPGDAPRGWLDERIGTRAFFLKYGRKAFPVHTTFFFGEMALFSFVILVLTGIYLGLIYVPSNAEVDLGEGPLPQAFASAQLIESIPVANLFRSVHHWCAHLMIASILLHTLRIFFTGTYRKPRELNWVIGVVLLGFTLVASFVGYSLPYDSYAVTATGIGYGIARSIPLVGNIAADLFFGGLFPTLGSLPRLYTIHVFVMPLLIMGGMAAHLLLVIKQKHTQPGYARRLAEPGRVLGVPLWPYQALLAGQLLLLMFGGLFVLSALVPIHPLDAYGPPGGAASDVKPDWYLMWIYGFLKLIPSGLVLDLGPINIGPEFIGGVLFPGLIFGVLTLAPWLDRSNYRGKRFEYLEPPTQAPARLASGVAVLVFVGAMFLAAYYDELGIPLWAMWAIALVAPLASAVLTYGFAWARSSSQEHKFDPTASPEEPSLASTAAD